MTEKNLTLVGKITSSHGIKGAVKVASFMDGGDTVLKYKNLYNKDGEELIFKKVGVLKNNTLILEMKGISTRNQSDELRDMEIFVKNEDLEDLDDDEFFVKDLLNMKVVDDKNKKGIVSNVANHGAGDILEVQWDDKKLESFPFTNDFVETVDFENNLVKVKSQKYI